MRVVITRMKQPSSVVGRYFATSSKYLPTTKLGEGGGLYKYWDVLK